MPIFEFECIDCGTEFEKLIRRACAVSDVACPVCGSVNVDEKISVFSSMVKGGSSSSGACAPSGG